MTSKRLPIQGSLPALVTPFRDGAVDEAALRALARRQIEGGSTGLVVNGTTGEAPALTDQEWARTIALVVDAVNGERPVIAGCGTANLEATIGRVRHAADLGADAALVVTPYYVRPSQDGLRDYFLRVADASPLAILLYDVPARAGRALSVDVQAELAAHDRVIGVKDATGDMAKATDLHRRCGPDYVLLSGDDSSALGFNAHGGVGCISVTANIAPRLCAAFQAACAEGRWAEARRLHERLAPLHAALFVDASPAPTKYALAKLGLCAEQARSPITPADPAARAAVDAAMAELAEDL